MIVKTTIEINGITYDHNYSDIGMKIMRDGVTYEEAVDPLKSNREYTETNEPIEGFTEDATNEDYQAALREMGVEV